MHIDFWFEFGSTYSYPAAMRVEELAGTYGVGINWRPFLLGVIFQAQGLTDSPFNLHEAKGRYMWRDLERTCEALNIPFRRPSRFPRNGLLAARVACCFDKEPWLSDFVRAVYRANFAEDADIADVDVISACIAGTGENAPAILEQAQSLESKERLRKQTDEATRMGIFGAPTMVAGDEDAMEWARRTA
jgi:2-hydroxychromene-2-carboxylate isomerase